MAYKQYVVKRYSTLQIIQTISITYLSIFFKFSESCHTKFPVLPKNHRNDQKQAGPQTKENGCQDGCLP